MLPVSTNAALTRLRFLLSVPWRLETIFFVVVLRYIFTKMRCWWLWRVRMMSESGWQEDLDHGNPLGMGGWVKGWWGCCEVLLLFLVFKQMFFILLPDICGLEYHPQTQVFRAPNLLLSSFHKWSIILPPFFWPPSLCCCPRAWQLVLIERISGSHLDRQPGVGDRRRDLDD